MIKTYDTLPVEIRKNMKGAPGEVKITSLATPAEMLDHARLYALMELEPGSGIGFHEHHGETEIFFVIEGTITWNDGEKETEVNAGGIMICEDGKGHGMMNNGDVKAKLTALIIVK